jgi:hypothetical protein
MNQHSSSRAKPYCFPAWPTRKPWPSSATPRPASSRQASEGAHLTFLWSYHFWTVNTMGRHARSLYGMIEGTSRPDCSRDPYLSPPLPSSLLSPLLEMSPTTRKCGHNVHLARHADVDRMDYADSHMYSFDTPATPSSIPPQIPQSLPSTHYAIHRNSLLFAIMLCPIDGSEVFGHWQNHWKDPCLSEEPHLLCCGFAHRKHTHTCDVAGTPRQW